MAATCSEAPMFRNQPSRVNDPGSTCRCTTRRKCQPTCSTGSHARTQTVRSQLRLIRKRWPPSHAASRSQYCRRERSRRLCGSVRGRDRRATENSSAPARSSLTNFTGTVPNTGPAGRLAADYRVVLIPDWLLERTICSPRLRWPILDRWPPEGARAKCATRVDMCRGLLRVPSRDRLHRSPAWCEGTLTTSAARRDVPDHKGDRDHRRCNGNDSNGGGGDNRPQ